MSDGMCDMEMKNRSKAKRKPKKYTDKDGIPRHPCKEDFGEIADSTLFIEAWNLAKEGHRGQKRSNGEAYFNHVARTALRAVRLARNRNGSKVTLIAVACMGLLHDMIEDCGMTQKRLADIFGEDIAKIVATLSRKKGETYFSFIMRIKDDIPLASIIKLADLQDNMESSEEGSRLDKYRFAQFILENK